jgi:hypothetical protein
MLTLPENAIESMPEVLKPVSSEESSKPREEVNSLNEDESAWTVQSSAKRRLAPQYVISKSDLGADNPKNKINQDALKKKGLKLEKQNFYYIYLLLFI